MIEVERLTEATSERVWALLSDIDAWDRLLPTVQSIERLDDGPIAVGARFRIRQPGLPAAVYQVTDWAPESGFEWVSSSLGVRTTARHHLVDHDGGTRLVLGLDWSGPLAGAVRVLFGSKVTRMVEQEADAFVRLAGG